MNFNNNPSIDPVLSKLKNQPVEGMEIMQDLEKEGEEYVDGTIVDPKTGKEYRCKIWLDEENPVLSKLNCQPHPLFNELSFIICKAVCKPFL